MIAPTTPRVTRSRTTAAAVKLTSTLIPALLILGALLSAAAVAFGCDPAIADHAGGVEVIRWMYRLQWVFIGTTVVCALSLVGLVITSKRRGYWLIGLLPVVALFAWRFGISPTRPGAVDDQPTFVSSLRADWLAGDDAVIGVAVGEQSYAIPLAAMSAAPVVVHTERDRRLMVTWSAGAQLATACRTDRTLRGRDLRIVCSPRGVLMIFNSRLGEFFDALTLCQRDGKPLTGFDQRLPAEVTTWDAWKAAHADTLLLDPRWTIVATKVPAQQTGETVVFIASTPPIVVPSLEPGEGVANVTNGLQSALLFRDAASGRLRAFDRCVDHDLYLRFKLNTETRRRGVAFIDTETNSGWSAAGECIEGPLAKTRLKRLVVIEKLPADAARYWVR